MPHVVNGIGTWYCGRERIHTLRGVCEFCRAAGDLSSYDTTNYFVVFFVPVIPLGKKRILRQCSRCSKHRVTGLCDWEAAKAKDSAAVLEKLRADPDDREAILHALSLAMSYQDQTLFDRVAETLAGHRTEDAEIQTLLGQGYDYFSRRPEAETAYRHALKAVDTSEGRERLGLNLLKQGRPEDAEPLLAHCYNSPNGSATIYWLVTGYQAQGRHDDALRVIDAAVDKWPALEADKGWAKLRQVSTKYRTTSKRVAAPLLASSATAGYREGGWRARAPKFVLPVLLLAAFLAYVGGAIYIGRNRAVYLVNGTPIPYTATVNGTGYPVMPGRPTPIRVPEGDIAVALKGPGVPAEEQACRLETPFWTRPFARRTFVLNPDRVAVVAREVTIYSTQPVPADEPDVRFTGQLLHEFQNIDYEFAPFPPQISVKGGDRFKKYRLDLPPIPDAEARLRSVMEAGSLPEAQEYARRWLAFQPNDSAMLLWLVTQLSPEDAIAFLKPRLAERPVRSEWHRAYQMAVERGQPDRDLIPEYRALVESARRSPDAVYLLARLCPHDECLKLLAEAAGGRSPSHLAENALGYHALAEGRFDDAVRWCGKAIAGDPGNLLFEMQFEHALWANRSYDELLERCAVKLAANPDGPAAVFLKARVLLARGDRAGAQQAVDEVLGRLGAPAGQRNPIANVLDLFEALVKRDRAAFLRAAEAGGKGDPFTVALLQDRPEQAAASVRDTKEPVRAARYGLLFLCAERNGKTAVANEALANYVAALRRGGHEERAFAALLTRARPTAEQLKDSSIDVNDKRIAVAVALRKFPELGPEAAAFARRLNFDFDAEGLCLAQELR
jgi:tetratricopeptide (TPR) repeat protein